VQIQRRILRDIFETLIDHPFVLVEGPPRSGKTSLAAQIQRTASAGALTLDAGNPASRHILFEPELTLGEGRGLAGRILVVDRADLEPACIATLAAFAASEKARGGGVVLLGTAFQEAALAAAGVTAGPELPGPLASAAPDEPAAPASAAARLLRLGPLSLPEAGWESRSRHWLRGGYPEAFCAANDEAALAWLRSYLDSLADSRLAASGLPWAPLRTRNLLSMLAEAHGTCLNENAMAASLGLSRPTVARAIAALARAGILRGLPAIVPPSGVRAVRSEKLYVRDSGLLHALLGFRGSEDLAGSARLAGSWEGYVVGEALAELPSGLGAGHYRSKDGAALELVFTRGTELLGGASIRWARQGRSAPRGAVNAASALGLGPGPDEGQGPGGLPRWLVVPESEETELGDGFTAIGLRRFLERVRDLG
jgi:DNA-binding Lrp family transcriptional regulator